MLSEVVRRQEGVVIGPWTWGTPSVVAAGAVTPWHSFRLHADHMVVLPVPDIEPIGLAVSFAPTVLFVAAGLVRRRSVGMQLSPAVAALLVAAMRVAVVVSLEFARRRCLVERA